MPKDTIGRPGWFTTRTSASRWQEGMMKYGPRQTWVFSPSASRTSANLDKLCARNASQSSTAPQIAHWPGMPGKPPKDQVPQCGQLILSVTPLQPLEIRDPALAEYKR